jgi:hypothetical protein
MTKDGIDKKSINLLGKPPYRIKSVYDECFIIIRRKRELFTLWYDEGERKKTELVWIKGKTQGSEADRRTNRVMVTNRGKVRKPRKSKNYHSEGVVRRVSRFTWKSKKSDASISKILKKMVYY